MFCNEAKPFSLFTRDSSFATVVKVLASLLGFAVMLNGFLFRFHYINSDLTCVVYDGQLIFTTVLPRGFGVINGLKSFQLFRSPTLIILRCKKKVQQ